jgi:hypothetical protein
MIRAGPFGSWKMPYGLGLMQVMAAAAALVRGCDGERGEADMASAMDVRIWLGLEPAMMSSGWALVFYTGVF